ncbi:MAG: Holliday junction resolvase RuvX [Leptothrix sp. (in: b-proteobacteria)]
MTAGATPTPPPKSPPPKPPQSFLSFDYGRKRTGVASGNRVFGQGTPLTTVTGEGDAKFAPIARLIAEWQPDALVVGVPCHPDGNPHDNTRLAQRFARQLHGRFGLPVFEVDERYSTTEVLSAGARDADAAAAALLLDQYFRESAEAARAASAPEETFR